MRQAFRKLVHGTAEKGRRPMLRRVRFRWPERLPELLMHGMLARMCVLQTTPMQLQGKGTSTSVSAGTLHKLQGCARPANRSAGS